MKAIRITVASMLAIAPALLSTANADSDHSTAHTVTICHNNHSITIDEHGLNGHIPNHPGDYMGECVPGGGAPVCVTTASLSTNGNAYGKYLHLATAPCETAGGEEGVWVDSVSNTPSSGPAIVGKGSFRELRGS